MKPHLLCGELPLIPLDCKAVALVVIEMEVHTHHFAAINLRFFFSIADAAIRHANWDASKFRDKLIRDIEAHVSSVRNDKLSELKAIYEVRFLM